MRALGLCAVGARGGRRSEAGLHDGTLRQLQRVQQVFPVAAVEAELSVWSPEALRALLPWCEARGVGFLAAMPLGNGFLTGTLTPGEGFEPDDVRARHPRFTAEMMAANQPIVSRPAPHRPCGTASTSPRPRWRWPGSWHRAAM